MPRYTLLMFVVVLLLAIVLGGRDQGARQPLVAANAALSQVATPSLPELGGPFPEGVSLQWLAGGLVETRIAGAATLRLERLTLPPGAEVTLPSSAGPWFLAVETGAVRVIDPPPIAGTYGEGAQARLATGENATLRNETGDLVVVLQLRLDAATASEGATEVAGSATPARDNVTVEILLAAPVRAPRGPVNLVLARLDWQPGTDAGQRIYSGPVGLVVETGTLVVTGPSGTPVELAAGASTTASAYTAQRVQNLAAEPATALAVALLPDEPARAGGVVLTPTADVQATVEADAGIAAATIAALQTREAALAATASARTTVTVNQAAALATVETEASHARATAAALAAVQTLSETELVSVRARAAEAEATRSLLATETTSGAQTATALAALQQANEAALTVAATDAAGASRAAVATITAQADAAANALATATVTARDAEMTAGVLATERAAARATADSLATDVAAARASATVLAADRDRTAALAAVLAAEGTDAAATIAALDADQVAALATAEQLADDRDRVAATAAALATAGVDLSGEVDVAATTIAALATAEAAANAARDAEATAGALTGAQATAAAFAASVSQGVLAATVQARGTEAAVVVATATVGAGERDRLAAAATAAALTAVASLATAESAAVAAESTSAALDLAVATTGAGQATAEAASRDSQATAIALATAQADAASRAIQTINQQDVEVSINVDPGGLLAGNPEARADASAELGRVLRPYLRADCRAGVVLTLGHLSAVNSGINLAGATNNLLVEDFPELFASAALEEFADLTEPLGQVDIRIFFFTGCGPAEEQAVADGQPDDEPLPVNLGTVLPPTPTPAIQPGGPPG